MNYLIYIPFALFLFACGSNPNQNDQLSKDDLDALIEQELKNEQRAKFGGGNYSFETITDPPKVAELNKKILIEQKKSKALQNSQSNQSLGDKYKSGDQSVVPEIIQILKGNDVDKKRTLYFDLQRSYDDPIEYQITNEKIIKTVFENLKKKEDQANAIQLAGYMKLQGYIKQFENLLESADAENKNRLLYWLSEEGSSTLPLDYIIEKIQTKKIDLVKDYNAIDVLGSYSENGTANNQKRAIDACIKIYNDKLIPSSKFEETKSYWSSDNPANALIDVLLESSDPGVVAIANDLIKKDIAVGQATLFLCKLEGKTHQEKALALFQNEKNYSNGLKAVLELYKKDKDPAVIHKMLESIQEMDFTNYQIESLTKMLAKTELSLSEITKNIENETTRTRVSKTYLANQLSVNDIVKDLKEFGLSQGLSQDQIKNIDTEDTYGSSLAYSVLEASDVFLWFDAETGFIPCEYDALIKDFESISQGKLKLNVWMDAQMSSDDYTTYKIYVAANDKIYIMEPEDIGDWYDVEMVFGLMNKIAAEAGISEEYVFIDTGDQTVMAMFGNKSKVEAFANKYQL